MKLKSKARISVIVVSLLCIFASVVTYKAKAKARGFTLYSTNFVGQPATNTLPSATIVLSGGFTAVVSTVYSDPGVRTRTIFQE